MHAMVVSESSFGACVCLWRPAGLHRDQRFLLMITWVCLHHLRFFVFFSLNFSRLFDCLPIWTLHPLTFADDRTEHLLKCYKLTYDMQVIKGKFTENEFTYTVFP